MSPRKRHYHITISKEVLAKLPAATYDGEIYVIDSVEQVAPAIEKLSKSKIIGFDTETRPSFKKGQSNTVSLIQLCDKHACYLFRINMTGVTPEMKALFENAGKIKVGLSLHDDFHQLSKICELKPQGFIDLQQYVKSAGIVDNSLSRIYAIIFDKRISKGQRLTNWEAAELTPHQQTYAALDARACVDIYNAIGKRYFIPTKSKYMVPNDDPTDEAAEQNK